MSSDDLKRATDLSYSEGWNQTISDWRFFLGNPDNICLAADLGSITAGTATALNYSGKVAWIGMVLVDKRFRGQGVGRLLMEEIIEKLQHTESLKLDATPAGYPLYHKLGFMDELTICRMTTGTAIKVSEYETIENDSEAFSEKHTRELVDFDRKISGFDRSHLIEYLVRNYPDKAFVISKNRKITGFILGRDGVRYHYLGPVFAMSDDSACKLIAKALSGLERKPVAVDVLQDKHRIIKWLEMAGFEKQRQFTRMYLKSNEYRGLIENQYLIAGPEFG